jgi:hypothetical protein
VKCVSHRLPKLYGTTIRSFGQNAVAGRAHSSRND